MAKIKMSEIEAQISNIKESVKDSSRQSDMESRLAKVLNGENLESVEIDVNDSDFEATHKNNKIVQDNIAKLVFGLDEITQVFGAEFANMSKQTKLEKFVGIFSNKKSKEMSTNRVKNTDIGPSLEELIRKSDQIGIILNEQLAIIKDRKARTIEGRTKVNDYSIEKAGELEKINESLDNIVPQIQEVETKLVEATDEERKKLEKEHVNLQQIYNDLIANKESLTAVQQSLERYASQFNTYVDSLTKQEAAQKTMIDKLKLDTEQRTILYDALTQSIKTSNQQDIAHKIDDVGRETDNMAENLIAQHGISANNRVMSMLESHTDYMLKSQKVAESGRMAQQEFLRRFANVANKVNKGDYIEESAN